MLYTLMKKPSETCYLRVSIPTRWLGLSAYSGENVAGINGFVGQVHALRKSVGNSIAVKEC